MKLAPEDGTGSPLESKIESGAVSGQATMAAPSRSTLVQDLVQLALLGSMPILRSLKPNEAARFSAIHINMVFDQVQGPMTNTEIAEKYSMNISHVSVVLNHPFAEVLRAAILGQIAESLADPLERMRAYTHECIDVKVQIMRDIGTPKVLRDRVASDFLDRVGYGSRKQIDLNRITAPQVPAPLLERFSHALEGSQRVAELPYDRFVQKGGVGEGGMQVVPSAEQVAEPPERNTDKEGLPSNPPTSLSLVKEKVA